MELRRAAAKAILSEQGQEAVGMQVPTLDRLGSRRAGWIALLTVVTVAA
jgi:hypothetical protein